jgi:hypothetical protein
LDRHKIEEYYKTKTYLEFSNEFNAIKDVQRLELKTSIGNFNEDNFSRFLADLDNGFDWDTYIEEEVFTVFGGWMPLMTLHGPLHDCTEDYYSIFYSSTIGDEIEYRAMSWRWNY